MLKNILQFAHSLLEEIVAEGDVVIDGTIGNGHDTLFLAQLVGKSGRVFGFDIQQNAIQNTLHRLTEHQLNEQVTLFHASHDELHSLLPSSVVGQVKGAIYNLGYLPGGDKSIVTTPQSTIQSISQLMKALSPGGIIVLVIYHGHPEGKIEKDKLLSYVTTLDQSAFRVLQYQFINQKNDAPFIVAIEKKHKKETHD